MAMIICTECGKEISDKAKVCPHCGFDKVSDLKKRSYLKRGILIWFLIPVELIVALVTAAAIESDFANKIVEVMLWGFLFLNIVIAGALAVKCGRDIKRSANTGEKISTKNIFALLLSFAFVVGNASFAYRAFEERIGVNLGGVSTICILLWALCGVFCYGLIKNKGYPKKTCWIHCVGGFLAGVIWLIVVLCKKPYCDLSNKHGMSLATETTISESKINKYIGKKIPKKYAVATIVVVALVVTTMAIYCLFGYKLLDYKDAQKFFDKGEYLEAAVIFEALDDYKDSAVKLNESRLLYAKELYDTGDYKESLKFFKMCQVDGDLAADLDRMAEELVAKGDYKNAKGFLFLHDMDEEQMQEFQYQYLVWQMANREYDDTADTFTAIRGYKDTLTNDAFAGARLLSMKSVTEHYTEANYRLSRIDTISQTISFQSNTLRSFIFSFTSNLISAEITNKVEIEDSWEFYFEGRNIYIKDGEEFVKGGSIGKFYPASEEAKESVTLSLNLPGMWKVTNVVFEQQ